MKAASTETQQWRHPLPSQDIILLCLLLTDTTVATHKVKKKKNSITYSLHFKVIKGNLFAVYVFLELGQNQ